MAADAMAAQGLRVLVVDAMPTPGRKFLIAGRGGLNLTHSEPRDVFLSRYGAAAARIAPLIDAFPPERLRAFADELGQETFVGTSGRVFPRAMKASPMLRAWRARLESAGVAFRLRTRFLGFGAEGALRLETAGAESRIAARATVLALGGASWPRLGSDGAWTSALAALGVDMAPFAPSNCGVHVAWSPILIERFAGQPLKRVWLRAGDHIARGDAVVTRRGLEGGPLYALSPHLRDALREGRPATLELDLRPDIGSDELAARLAHARKGDSLANRLRKAAGLSPVAIALAREAGAFPAEPAALARAIKSVRLDVSGVAGLERAISSAGGVRFEEVDEDLMLHRKPGVFLAGEMLDWEAPTGGYLLQACFSSGYVAGRAAAEFARRAQGGQGR